MEPRPHPRLESTLQMKPDHRTKSKEKHRHRHRHRTRPSREKIHESCLSFKIPHAKCGEGHWGRLLQCAQTWKSLFAVDPITFKTYSLEAALIGFISATAFHPSLQSSSSLANLNDFASPLLITSQYRPRTSIRLHKGYLQLRAHDLECRCLGINWTKQRNHRFVSFWRGVGCDEVEGGFHRLELYFCSFFIDFLEEEGGDDCARRLIEIMPVHTTVNIIPPKSISQDYSPDGLQ